MNASRSNVETVRRFVEEFNRGAVGASGKYADPDLVIYADPSWPGKQEFRGPEGAREAAAEWSQNFDRLVWEIERIVEEGDKVVVLFRLRGQIKGSAESVEMPFGGVFRFDAGRVIEVRYFFSQDAALEAGGVEA